MPYRNLLPRILSTVCCIITYNAQLVANCQQEIIKENVIIKSERVDSKCLYNITLKNIKHYTKTLNKIPPVYIINALDKNVPAYRKIIKKYNNYISIFLSLMKERKNRNFYIYLKTTIQNKKSIGVKILIGLLLSADSKKHSSVILEQFASEEVYKEIANNMKLKNLVFPLLSLDLYTEKISANNIILSIFSNVRIPTSFFCKNFKEENLSHDQINLCLSNININDVEWVRNILFDKNIPFNIKTTAVITAFYRKIGEFDKMFIEYAKYDLITRKTEQNAVELFRSIIAYLGENPTLDGLKFASEITLDKTLPFVIRHEAITTLDKMRAFSNETFFVFIKILKDENNLLRFHAANFLGNLLLPIAIPYLKETVKNDPYNIARAYALESIGKIAKKRENKFVLQFINDPSLLVRLVAIQILLKNHYKNINISPVIKLISEDIPIFLPEDQMAKMLAYEILQEFAPPDSANLLIEKLKKEQDINLIYLINNTLNNLFSIEYTLNNNFDDNSRKDMIAFWKRIYKISKKNILNRTALHINGLKQYLTILNKKCNRDGICKFTIKPLFKSYTNKFYRKIKNFTNYNVSVFIKDKKVMEKAFDKKTWDFSINFLYPNKNNLEINIVTDINGRIFKQTLQ